MSQLNIAQKFIAVQLNLDLGQEIKQSSVAAKVQSFMEPAYLFFNNFGNHGCFFDSILVHSPLRCFSKQFLKRDK